MDYLNLKNKDSKWESVFSDNCLEYPKEKIITPLESFLEKEFDDKYLIGEKTLQARIKGCDRYGENNMPKFVKELIGKFLKNEKSDFDYGPSLFLVRQGNPVGGGKGFLECDYIPTLTTSLTAIIFYAVKGGRIFFRKLTINERAKAQGFPTDWARDVENYSEGQEKILWGNGVALPCVEFVIRNIKENETRKFV